MEMQTQPKERVIFDSYSYYGDEGTELAVSDLMSRDGLTETEVRDDYTDTEIFQHAMNMMDFDCEQELAALTAFFDGEKSDMSSFVNPIGGNPVIARGSVGRWDGTRTGMTVYDNLKAALDTAPSRFGGGNVLADCDIEKVWDENGHLFVHGAHHDGGVDVEIRQLTDAGAEAYEAIREAEDAWEPEPFTIAGNNATDWAFKTYDGSEQSIAQAMRDLWDESSFCPPPRYMEQAFGCPAEEYQLDPLPLERIGFEDEISEVDGLLNFYIPITFNADRVFGTDVETFDNDDWLNLYANYDMEHGEVADHLDLSLNRADGSIEYLTYPLDSSQRDALRQKMDAYCVEQVGKNLDAYAKEWAQSEVTADRSTGALSLTAMAAESRAASQALSDGGTRDEHAPDAR